jgi:hypothetical protein
VCFADHHAMRMVLSIGLALLPVTVAVVAVWRMSGRGALDAGYVSQGWLAEKRADTFDPSR